MVDSKIKDIDKLTEQEYQEGANFYDVEREICRIDGETYPMFYAKIINKQLESEMPFVLFLGKPGSGKTVASAKLGYDLTQEIGFYDGEYTPEENIHYENIDYMEAVYDSRNKVLHKPDINATLNVVDHHQDDNRAFENFIHLARIFGNLITGDSQYLWRCDTGIQISHTFRIVATSHASEYKYDVYYIDREPDAENKEVEKVFLQRWSPDLPPEQFTEFIKQKDKEKKKELMKNALDQAREQQQDGLEGIDVA